VKALAQLKGESDENEKIPETENSEKTAFSKTRQINAAPQRDLFLRCGIDFLRCSIMQRFPAPVSVRTKSKMNAAANLAALFCASKCAYEVNLCFKNNELARGPPI
jgi:hypothetical protein